MNKSNNLHAWSRGGKWGQNMETQSFTVVKTFKKFGIAVFCTNWHAGDSTSAHGIARDCMVAFPSHTPFILQISDLLWILSYFPFFPHWPQSIAHSLNFITHSTSKSNHLYFTRTLQNGLYSIVTGKKILKLV